MTPDELTVLCTAFESFAELVECSLDDGYVPSLYPYDEDDASDCEHNFRRWELCEVFDEFMSRNGFDRQAWRGSNVKDRSWKAFRAGS
jgi:hypothetical protein